MPPLALIRLWGLFYALRRESVLAHNVPSSYIINNGFLRFQ